MIVIKEKKLLTILAIEAAACVLFCILQYSVSGMFSSLIAFPFEQLGVGLRWLSLSGAVGNGIAILFYILLCLIPTGIWFFFRKKQKAQKIDILLLFLSALLFFVFYYMINPGLINTGTMDSGKWSLGSTFYSVLFGYLLVRGLLQYTEADEGKLRKGIRILLGAVDVILVYEILGSELGSLLQNISSVRSGNTGVTVSCGYITLFELNTTYVFLFLHFLIKILPCILNILVIFGARKLLDLSKEAMYQEENIVFTEKLVRFCTLSLIITIVADVGFNLLQLFFQNQLYQMDYVVNIPVFSLAFVLAIQLFARYIREMQRLKKDNDLFI